MPKVTFEREQWGNRTFDINVDGVSNYGLRADWIEAQRVKDGEAAMKTFFDTRGAEAYLTMWERAWHHAG
jgi:hypothetical protein